MKKYFLIVSVVLLVTIVGAMFMSRKKVNTQTHDKLKASLQFNWIPSATSAGDVVGLKRFASLHNLDLTADYGGPGINPIQLVESGQKTFAWIGVEDVLSANEKGADLVIIGVINDVSPAGYVSLKNKNITSPQDLVGKKVGVLPFGNTTMIYEIMLKNAHVDRSKIEEVTVTEDLKPFLSGNYDVQPVYVYDETVNLDAQHIDYNILVPEKFGVKLKGDVYVTKRSTLVEHPELVKAFIDTIADGWNFAVKNPEEAIAIMKDYAPDINTEREVKVLKKAIPYFMHYNNQPLNSSPESWTEAVQQLKDAGVVSRDLDISKYLFLGGIQEYYQNK